MVNYVVKVIAKAKDTNPSFAGETHIFYYGKAEHLLVSKDRYENSLPYLDVMAANYGYSRECDARRSYIYKTRFDEEEFWVNTVTIEKIEC